MNEIVKTGASGTWVVGAEDVPGSGVTPRIGFGRTEDEARRNLPSNQQRAAVTLGRLRSAMPAQPGSALSSAAIGVADAVGSAVDRAIGSLAPYGSRGDVFEANCEIEHVDSSGSVTRARLQYRFVGGNNR